VIRLNRGIIQQNRYGLDIQLNRADIQQNMDMGYKYNMDMVRYTTK
jgi:hypothetical protein